MRIVLNGQQAFGKAVLDALLAARENVVAVYGPAEKEGAKPDPAVAAARERGIPVVQPRSFKQPAVWEAFRALAPDVCMMAYVTLIVPEEFLNIPTHGTFQYHPSLLPRHRGPSAINWPIIQGERRTGLTIFWPDNGLDTGPVLLQKAVEIGPDDTLGSLYFERLFPLGVQAMLESLALVKAGKAPRIVQDEAQATYEGWCRVENVQVDWRRPVADVYNMLRGADPQPGAWSLCQGAPLQLFEARRLPAVGGQAGEIVAIDDEGLVVAGQGGAIRIGRVKPAGGAKQPAAEYASGRLKPGTVLGA
ncbi:MAG: methionyl-tRNA formyltransferase [Candidatus Lambdaproteobacteria bacterium]|nr:methionyl-tRNA formyltransferase [Candidatus Lambdaproteobacteria bacterium]